MILLAIAFAGMLQAASQESFAIRCDVQGFYHEMTQAARLPRTAHDIDVFHEVFYTPDWVLIDVQGQRHTWAEMHEGAIKALNDRSTGQTRQTIRELTTTSGGVIAVISFTTVRTMVDNEGRYGVRGASHTIAEVTTFRDALVRGDGSWRLKSREQIGAPRTLVDKLPPELDDPRCTS